MVILSAPMSVSEACAGESCAGPQLLTSVSGQHHPILKRLSRLMDSAGEETDADSESLELALLDVELTKFAAHQGIHIPAASPSASVGGSSLQQQLSTALISPKPQHHPAKAKPMQPGTVLQLVQQQSKFLDVLQCMIDKNVGLDKVSAAQKSSRASSSTAVQPAASSSDPAVAAAVGATVGADGAVTSPPAGGQVGTQQVGVLQVQYERQVADNHALKKRCLKVQKAMLRHMQAARAQAAAAEAAAEDARRREQQASATNEALHAQLTQQQHMLEAQQQQLSGMQEQLMQLKDMHKKKLSRYKAQLQQQYESQLAAATTAYTQELSLVHAVQLSAGDRFTSGGGVSSCSDSGPTPRQLNKKPRQSSATGAVPGGSSHSVLAAAAAGHDGVGVGLEAAAGSTAAAYGEKPTQARAAGGSSGGGKSSVGGSIASGNSKPSSSAGPGPVVAASVSTAVRGRAEQGLDTCRQDAGSSAHDASAAAIAAEPSGSSAGLHPLPSLPLAVEHSSQLLQQMSISAHLADVPFSSSQQQPSSAQQKAKKLQPQRQSSGSGGSHKLPETPRRATVNGSGPRQRTAAAAAASLASRGARSKTMPAAVSAGAAAQTAAAATSAAGPAGAAAAPSAAPSAEASGVQAQDASAAVDGSVAVAVAQQLQSHLLLLLAQQLAEHLPPELADIDPHAILSLQHAVAEHVEQQQPHHSHQHLHQEHQQVQAEGRGDSGEQQQEQDMHGTNQQYCSRQQRQHGASGELHVPEEVLHYAAQYQQGGEGSCRPMTATPSVLQHQHHQQVPEAAAQLAQHFVAGGEGTSRPLTAPSSDRTRAMRQQQAAAAQQPARSSSPQGRGGRLTGTHNEHPAVPDGCNDEV